MLKTLTGISAIKMHRNLGTSWSDFRKSQTKKNQEKAKKEMEKEEEK